MAKRTVLLHTHIPYYTLAVLTIKSSGVLFIPLLHAEHVYNEGHGVCHDKSHIVSPDTISFKTIFVDTPVLGFFRHEVYELKSMR